MQQINTKEYKTGYDLVGKLIHFDHTNKWYMHNPATVLANDTHKLLWDFDIQTDHLISARRPDLITIKKRELANLWTMLYRLPTEYNWKVVKRRISTSTMLKN